MSGVLQLSFHVQDAHTPICLLAVYIIYRRAPFNKHSQPSAEHPRLFSYTQKIEILLLYAAALAPTLHIGIYDLYKIRINLRPEKFTRPTAPTPFLYGVFFTYATQIKETHKILYALRIYKRILTSSHGVRVYQPSRRRFRYVLCTVHTYTLLQGICKQTF